MRRRVSESSTFQGRWVCPDLSAASCSVCRKAIAPLDSRSDGASTARARSSAALEHGKRDASAAKSIAYTAVADKQVCFNEQG